MAKVRLKGFRELERALAELPKATGKNVLRRTARGALEPMERTAEALAPQDSGILVQSVETSEKRTRRARKSRQPKKGIQMAMGPSGGRGALNYGTFVEFGTIDTPAQPFMRPAWDRHAEEALEHIKDNLGSEIEKAAARNARKLARAKR